MGPPPWLRRDLFEAPDAGSFGRQAFREAWAEFSRRAVRRALSAGDEAPRYYAERQYGAWRADLDGSGAELLALLRDPRDAYASLLEFQRIRGISAPDDLSAGAARQQALTFIDDQRERLRWIASGDGIEKATVRYERLVLEPASVAREIGDRLSVKLSPDSIVDDPSLRQMCATATTLEGSIGRWRRDLDPAVGRLFWSELGAELAALGFDP
jgi:hypothetical protein